MTLRPFCMLIHSAVLQDGIDIFDGTLDRIIIPVHLPAAKIKTVDGQPDSEWSVVLINLVSQTIEVFTPWKIIDRAYNALTTRFRALLAFEHQQRLGCPLGKGWDHRPAPAPTVRFPYWPTHL